MLKEITLSNLSESTEQEVFDWICINLLKQGEKSIILYSSDMHYPMYKNEDGLKCAAGWLMSDDEYEGKFERVGSWDNLVSGGHVPSAHEELIRDLQIIHDSAPVTQWKNQFTRLGNKLHLNVRNIHNVQNY